MNFAEMSGMSDQDALNQFNSIPRPSYSQSINHDLDSMETIHRDFRERTMSDKERDALREDLNLARGYPPKNNIA